MRSVAGALENREQILDLAAELQMRRRRVAERVALGLPVAAKSFGAGSEIDRQILAAAAGWSECRSLRPRVRPDRLRRLLRTTREALDAGLHIVSIYDEVGLGPSGLAVLAQEDPTIFRVGFAPVEIKLIDRRAVLLQGPFIGGEPTLMLVEDRACLAAAWAYWSVCEDASRAADAATGLDALTARQHAVVVLLADGAADAAIASALDVSVRTVRYDVATILRVLNVRSRFAAGRKFEELLCASAEHTGVHRGAPDAARPDS